ncbi:hypothetical protein J5868_00080 [Candidatus Saccharibacteria bacterium]|nr:hypothetical protein [Candidatus Saccharibacteria bacterium]
MHQENHQVLHYATLSLVFFTLLSGFVLSQHTFVSATDPSATATATVHVAEACTLSANNTSSHNAEMSNGTYEEGIGSTTFTVKCNDASGFALYAIGYSNEEYGNTNMIGDSTALTIPTGTEAVLGNTSSHWAMKVTKDTTSYTPANLTINNSFDSYHVVPDTYTKVATYTTGTDGVNGTGSSVIATYDARVSATQAADSYVGKVKFTLVHPSTTSAPIGPLKATDCPAGNVCYAPNANDIVGSMDSISSNKIASSPTAGKISVGTSATTINLIAPNYKREGYGFAGWSTDFTTTNASTIYGPNETLTVPSTTLATKGMILYPVWVASSGTLQEFSCASSSLTPASYNAETGKVSATLSSVTALTDSRDGNVYAVAKLADGYCWMIENLRLDANHSTDGSLAQGYDTGFVGLPDSEDANFDNGTANNLYSTGNYRTMPRYNNNNIKFGGKNASGTDLIASYNTNNTDTAQWYSYGNYYSWPAAKATITSYTSYSATDAVSTSICPAGWVLPLGYQSTGALDDNEQSSTWRVRGFSYLDRMMGGTGADSSTNSVTSVSNSANWRSFPNNFVYSGDWNGAQAYNRSSSGLYWSSSARDGYNSYSLSLHSSLVYPGTRSLNKNLGYSVRCVSGS